MVIVLKFFLTHLLGLQCAIALRTSLLILSHISLEPFFDTFIMEEVPTNRDSTNNFIIFKIIHAYDALGCLKFINLRVKSDIFKFINELFDVFSFLQFYLLLKFFIISLHLLDLSLKTSYIIYSYNVFIPIWVWLIHIKVNTVCFIYIASHNCR